MYDLAAIKNLNIKKENYPTSKKDLPQSIWDKSEVPNHSDSKSFQLAKSYFTKHRKIPIESYSDLLRKGLIRINKYKDVLTLVYPSLTPETAALAMESKPYGIKRIQRIFLNPDGSKHRMGKKHLGSNENDSAAFVIPPLNKKDGQNYAVVFEGLEDALSIRSEYPGSWFLVATDKAGLKHVQGFFKSGKLKECLVIADHDTDFKPEVTGQALAWQLGQTLEDMGIKVTVKMPPKPKEDANSALQSEGLGTWLKSLIDIPEEYRNGNEWPIPKQLPDAPPPPPQLDPDILPQPLADFAKAAALENEVSPEAVAAFLLSSIGAVTGSRFCIKPDSRKKNWYEFPIRSTALVMDVSQNKSGVFRAAIGPLERLQRSYKEENEKAASDYFYEQEIHERLRKGLLSRLEKLQKDGEPTSQVEQELRNMILPNVPDKKTISITAGTRQKIIEILSKGNERGLLIKRDELAGWFAGLDRPGNEGDREFYLEGMTVALNYDNHTIGRGEDFTPVLALSICGTIQKSKLRRLLSDMEKGYRDDGMLQRFMWVCPQTKSFDDFEDAYTRGFCGVDEKLLVEIQNIFERLDALTPDDIGAINSNYAPAPWIGFDEQAQEEFLAWRQELQKNVLTDENLSDGLESHLKKSERLVSGLALSFHAVKCATAKNINDVPPTVDSDALNRSVDIWDVLRHHANAVYSLGQTSTLEAARLIYARIRKLIDKDSKFSVRDIKQKKWRGIHDDKLIDEVLELLVEKDIVNELEPPPGIKGRPPSRRFLVNPLALEETDV